MESNSEFACQIVAALSKNEKAKLSVDCKDINKMLIRDHYTLPLIDDLLDRLAKAKWFCHIHLRNGCPYHVRVSQQSQQSQQFEFSYVPFDLVSDASSSSASAPPSSSSPVIMRWAGWLFQKLVSKGILLVHLDDILILAETVEQQQRS